MKINRILGVVIFSCMIGISFGQDKPDGDKEVKLILKKYTCTKCHATSIRLVGPSFNSVAERGYAKERLVELIMKPEPGNWPGYGEMPKIDTLKREDVEKVAGWIVRKYLK